MQWQSRKIVGISQSLPSHIRLDGVDAAAAFTGQLGLLADARTRWKHLTDRFPNTATAAALAALLRMEKVARGVRVTSLFMDIPTYDAYARFGTDTDRHGQPIGLPLRRATPHLTAAEQALYDRLTDPTSQGPRRIEQERIPLQEAAEVVGAAEPASQRGKSGLVL